MVKREGWKRAQVGSSRGPRQVEQEARTRIRAYCSTRWKKNARLLALEKPTHSDKPQRIPHKRSLPICRADLKIGGDFENALCKVVDKVNSSLFIAEIEQAAPPKLISCFKELAFVFTNEYICYRTIKKQANHLFNLRKKSDESLRDYIKRFKAEKTNIVGCDDLIVSSAFKKSLQAKIQGRENQHCGMR
ncbi:unnamed protein product [Prunus armeniaca]